MSIYDKPTKTLMLEFAEQELSKGQTFGRQEAISWFARHYPKIKSNTVGHHVNGMSVNNGSFRQHHPNIKPGSGHDLFFKVDRSVYRLWEPENDPAPRYKGDQPHEAPASEGSVDDYEDDEEIPSSEFAYEKDLQSYLARNLATLEPGLKLYDDEGLTGVEYPVGGRFIDLLCVDKDENFVVIELKVSKSYDRVVGQLLRYMGWVEKNMAEGILVRGIIVGSEISQDLILATSRVSDVQLFEYEISFGLKEVAE